MEHRKYFRKKKFIRLAGQILPLQKLSLCFANTDLANTGKVVCQTICSSCGIPLSRWQRGSRFPSCQLAPGPGPARRWRRAGSLIV